MLLGWAVFGGSAAGDERVVRLVAHHLGAEVHAGAPRVSAELPETGERFEGLLPPVVAAPAFARGELRIGSSIVADPLRPVWLNFSVPPSKTSRPPVEIVEPVR